MSWLTGYLGNQPSDNGDNSGASSRPRRVNLPYVNYVESDEEDLESGLNFDSPLTSPRRPHQSPSISPRALLQPDPPLPEEVLAIVGEKLSDLPDDDLEEEEGIVIGDPNSQDNQADLPVVDEAANMVDFDQEDGEDSATAMDNLRSVQCPFNKGDIVFWFSQLEDQLTLIGVKKQWTKKIALVRFLPPEIQNEVKSLLKMGQTAAGTDIYYRIKAKLLKQYGPKPEDAYLVAKNLVLTDKPSQLGQQLVEVLCPAEVKLDGCHCDRIVWGLFREKIPIVVRNHLADMKFNKDTYEAIFDKADQVWDSNRSTETPQVASIASAKAVSTPEVAAVQGQSGKNKNKGQNNKNKGQNRGQNQNSQKAQNQPSEEKKKKMIDDDGHCRIHAKWKENATFCAAPWGCKMKSIYKAPQ